MFTNGEFRDGEEHFEIQTDLTLFHTKNMYPELFALLPLGPNIAHICLSFLDFNQGKILVQKPKPAKPLFVYKFPYRNSMYSSNNCIFCEGLDFLEIVCVECDTKVCMDCMLKCSGFSQNLSLVQAEFLFEKYMFCEFDGPENGCLFQCFSDKILKN